MLLCIATALGGPWIHDDAGLIDDPLEGELHSVAERLRRDTGLTLVVVTGDGPIPPSDGWIRLTRAGISSDPPLPPGDLRQTVMAMDAALRSTRPSRGALLGWLEIGRAHV